ncbi:MAG: hypothetical protein H6634_13695 [Anaerolineales bacterium]|nr:hypothetical protein [Anaerolineales bacterium]
MKITRDVITDLLPVYLSGEASADTRTLIEEFLTENPEFAELIAEQGKPLEKTNINLPKENEMKTLENTKSLLRKRSLYLAFAIFFSLFTVSFKFGAGEAQWMWADSPIVAVVCLIVGVVMWVGYTRTNRGLNGSGL